MSLIPPPHLSLLSTLHIQLASIILALAIEFTAGLAVRRPLFIATYSHADPSPSTCRPDRVT
jgi:hypothetical protein